MPGLLFTTVDPASDPQGRLQGKTATLSAREAAQVLAWYEELLAAERLAIRNPGGIEGRPGWLEGIVATLQWAWAASAAPPIEVPSTIVG